MQAQNGDLDGGLGGEVVAQGVVGESPNSTGHDTTHTEHEGNAVSTGQLFHLAC